MKSAASPDTASRVHASVADPARAGGVPHYPSAALFLGGKEVIILHAQREYRLRITASGKLILTA